MIVTLGASDGGGLQGKRHRAAGHRASFDGESSLLLTSGPGESDEGKPIRMPRQPLAAGSNCYQEKQIGMAEVEVDMLEFGEALRGLF